MEKIEIFPPCGVKLGQKEEPKFICPAIIWEGEPPDNLIIDSILEHACDAFVENGSCPEIQYRQINQT